jgi:hypothetical protein
MMPLKCSGRNFMGKGVRDEARGVRDEARDNER